ncbi:MAG: MarR family transcriptional regulator [Steroidobacteraceae bacterium]|jgi:pyruvate, orthophosphate dikinase
MDVLAPLQLARVKGLLSAETASSVLGADLHEVARSFENFRAQGWLEATPRGWRLTPAGRKFTLGLMEEERAALDAGALRGLYQEFCSINLELKATMVAWQVRADGTLNDHADKVYDGAIVNRLCQVHDRADPVIRRLEQAVPRLAHYRKRLSHALDRIRAGEANFVARPIIDSYHTVWFELHEDLIAVSGLTRAAEAQAGRAQ